MFRYLLSILSLLIISPCFGDIASSEYVNEMRDNVQAKIDKKADNSNYTQNMVLQTDNSGNVVATTVGTDLFADGAIETVHLADGAVTNADLAGMIDIKKLNLGTLPTRGKHIMIWNAETQKYVFERYATSILPEGYTQLEYIESTGTQYIDTGLVLNNNSGIDINYEVMSYRTGGAKIFGYSGTNDFAYNSFAVTNKWSSLLNFTFGYGSQIIHLPNSKYTNIGKHNIVFNNKVLYVDNELVETFNDETFTTGNIVIGNINFSTGVTESFATVRHREHTFTNNDDIVFKGIPAKRNSDNVVGMYDTVSGQFFTNAGTGTFIAGPEIE